MRTLRGTAVAPVVVGVVGEREEAGRSMREKLFSVRFVVNENVEDGQSASDAELLGVAEAGRGSSRRSVIVSPGPAERGCGVWLSDDMERVG